MSDLRVVELTVGDDPAAWAAAGFAMDDSGTTRIGEVAVRAVGADGARKIRGWTLGFADGHADGPTDLDGLTTAWAPVPPAPAPLAHPNGATLIDHVVLLSPDVDRTLAVFADLDVHPRRVRHTDQYGFPARQTFLRAGEVILELIGGDEPMGDGPAGFFGLACTVTDLDAVATLLGDALGTIKDAVQPGRRIATVRHKELGLSVPLALMTPEP